MGGCGPGQRTTLQTDSGISIGEKHKKKMRKEAKISASKDGIVKRRKKRERGGGGGEGWSRTQ